ncbi:maltase-glucoamylase, intestinal [Chanos chanos]|uniref:alpha-glucosidase n=1 Tax=Chanos chanos TaxID=29144 RepID=A0A6J2X100_CHACN|nr:maltase-glucoamylase, intestinal-like [Chanos chanos]
MGKRKFSGLEIVLMVLFLMVTVVAVVLIVLMATGEPAVTKDPTHPTDPTTSSPINIECPNIALAERVDCFPEPGASQQRCEARGCCWSPRDETNIPWCFFSKNHGYKVVSKQTPDNTHMMATLERMNAPSLFGADIPKLTFHAWMQTKNRFRFKITDAEKTRFEVPHEHVKPPTTPLTGAPNYEFELLENPFGVRVRRASNKKILFDTTMGPLVFADQFLQLSSKLPSENIYGLGEHVHQNFRHDLNWRTWPIFTRDAFPNGGTHNLYGHYPYFTCLEDNQGKSFGVFLMNSNAMEVTLQPAPAITYRTIGGVLDFYILLADTPEQLTQEFTELIGRPVIPAYWSLGFQLSRWNYGSLDEVKRTVERNVEAGLPFDIQYTDIDYMEDKKIFTYDMVKFKDLPQFADYLHNKGMKYILILDPAVATSKRINGPYEAYDTGSQANAWITEADGKTPVLGEVWPGETVFPDFTSKACIDWWVDENVKLHNLLKHDAIWIDMNEVASFVKGSKNGCTDGPLNYPPYTPRILDGLMYSKTLCMDFKQHWGNHYDVHSLYGYSMVLATEEAVKQVYGTNRSLMLTRSSFPGVGKYSGHWLGDNGANWNDIKWAIPGMLEFSLFGVPYIGADICGFFDDSPEELCRRWMQVGAFYPFSRNHNAENYKPQDPAIYGKDSLLMKSSIKYLNIRYTLLPYLYTLFYKAHVSGETVVRPMMHEFYSDPFTYTVDRQFLWGRHLLITPILDPGTEHVQAYIPDARWYEYESEMEISERKQHVNMYLPADKLGLHIRGGAILPTQRPAVTTTFSRRNPMGLIIALDDRNEASGELFWDDGDSRGTVESGKFIHYQFKVLLGILTMTVTQNGYTDPNNLKFEDITVLGVEAQPGSVSITQGETITSVPASNIMYDATKKVLHLKGLGLELGKDYKVSWDTVIADFERIDCHPEENSDETKCRARGCNWQTSNVAGVPWCYFPTDYGYTASGVSETATGWQFDINRNTKYSFERPGSPNINRLRVEISYLTGHSLRFKVYDPLSSRYEVPVPLNLPPTLESDAAKRMYTVEVSQNPFGIRIIRKETKTVIWDSVLPGFTFSDMFIQISTRLPTEYIYGFGETEHTSFKHEMNWHTWGMFTKDQPPGYKLNCYGVHPFYMGLESSNHAHAVLLLNSNAMDVTVQPTPALTYRTLGGILDFYMMLGPTPEQVVQEYTDLIGRPVLPAYWSLGFQLCRYGYVNDQEISDLYHDMRAAGIPYDVQYADIDYMERQLAFKLDMENFAGLPALVDRLQAEGMRFMFITDPAMSGNETQPYRPFTNGVTQDVFIKWPEALGGDIVWGKVWPDYPNVIVDDSLDWDTQVELYRAHTAFPDFLYNKTSEWWYEELLAFYNIVKYDGLWIDMNEPASFVHGTVGGVCRGENKYDFPPYMPPLESKHMGLKHKTLCMNAEQRLNDGTPVKHYDVHNLYGWSHAKPSYDALLRITGKRGIVVSRSTYPSSGRWVGHWLGDNNASWDQLYKSIIGMLEFSLFGISYTGADICGFFNKAEYEMCLRWMHLGAFYPYSRNHNGLGNPRQDPVAWDQPFAEASRDVLNIRYTLLPYLYTLLFEAHSQGSTVVRPLLHEFVNDRQTWEIHRQFLWGPALLISPALDPGVTTVRGYIPDARWYDYHTTMDIGVRKQYFDMYTPLNHINLHVRGGHILPWQAPAANTNASRTNPLGLLVALGDDGTAQGSLFWDDGDGIDTYERGAYLYETFSVSKNTLSITVIHNGLAPTDRLKLGKVRVWGAGSLLVTEVTMKVPGQADSSLPFTHNTATQELEIDATARNHFVDTQFTITWNTGV